MKRIHNVFAPAGRRNGPAEAIADRSEVKAGKAAVANDGLLTLSLSQTFTSVSEEGNELLNQYKTEDFAGRLRNIAEFMNQHFIVR